MALLALKALSILHADVKPDTVMLVCKQDQPTRVKLAIALSKVHPGLELQPTGYTWVHLAQLCLFSVNKADLLSLFSTVTLFSQSRKQNSHLYFVSSLLGECPQLSVH